jgi:glutamine phosphoribosylpyrophosphate amidotransferase
MRTRGQESAGIVTSEGGEAELKLHKDHGLVSSIFSEETLSKLHGT